MRKPVLIILLTALCFSTAWAGYDDGNNLASAVQVDSSLFSGNLSILDDTVQKALETINRLTLGGLPGDSDDIAEGALHLFVSSEEKSTWTNKQDSLLEGTDYLNKAHLDAAYLGIIDTAADSSKLNGQSASYYQAAFGSQTANYIYAAPNGSSGTPLFRLLVSADLPSSISSGSIGITIDGGYSVVTTGSKGYVYIPFACTIVSATLLADQTGSIEVDVKKCAYGSFPGTASITASTPPTLSSAQSSQDATLTGWTTSVSAGDVIEFYVNSASTITRATLILKVTK